jgi:hypothetical protein
MKPGKLPLFILLIYIVLKLNSRSLGTELQSIFTMALITDLSSQEQKII